MRSIHKTKPQAIRLDMIAGHLALSARISGQSAGGHHRSQSDSRARRVGDQVRVKNEALQPALGGSR
jgi:hypothetical protein